MMKMTHWISAIISQDSINLFIRNRFLNSTPGTPTEARQHTIYDGHQNHCYVETYPEANAQNAPYQRAVTFSHRPFIPALGPN